MWVYLLRALKKEMKIYVCSCVRTEEICSRGGKERKETIDELTPAVANDTHLAI